MIIVNRIDNNSFGPFASSTGIFMLIGGLIIAYFNLTGLFLAIIGAFVAFTSTSTIIDTANRRIRHADFLFGLLPFGKWIDIKDDMKLGIKKVRRGYTGYIRGTQPMSIVSSEIRIILYDSSQKQILPVKRCKSDESALHEIKEISSLLGISYQ
ncbi:MAG TPA: hypothetical protein VK213_02580 [Bacteroidales bacterium]|nr:hypothetical protein [Bacteroidales bacterium]